jgi:hypothetical protein
VTLVRTSEAKWLTWNASGYDVNKASKRSEIDALDSSGEKGPWV